jgi:hypothetical protein
MKSQLTPFFAFLLLLATMIPGCKNLTPFQDNDPENPVTFDTIVSIEQYFLLGDSANPYCSLQTSFIYPFDYQDTTILQKVQKQFLTSFFGDNVSSMDPKMTLANYAKSYINGYKALEQEFSGLSRDKGNKQLWESLFTHYEVSSNEIRYNKNNLLSYSDFIEYHTGGAHPKHACNNHVLSLLTGEKLKEEDIFINGYQEELAGIIVKVIAKDLDAETPEELENRGYFNVKEIYPNNNFYADDEGITYTFNEYEIAAYHIGQTDVTLTYDLIRHLIRENSPLTPLVFTKK